ncbi:hypothetical protein ACFL14_00120 [Patescibacteria group bacterium]
MGTATEKLDATVVLRTVLLAIIKSSKKWGVSLAGHTASEDTLGRMNKEELVDFGEELHKDNYFWSCFDFEAKRNLKRTTNHKFALGNALALHY